MFTGTQLRLLRQSRGLMQKEMADSMEIAQQRLSALEKSKRKITDHSAEKALKALKLTKEEAARFLNNRPPSAGGGGSKILNHLIYFFAFEYFSVFKSHDKDNFNSFLFASTGWPLCTNDPARNY